jgi:biopolymer transport protein TolR
MDFIRKPGPLCARQFHKFIRKGCETDPARKEDAEMIRPIRLIAFAAVFAGMFPMSGCDLLARLFPGKPQREQIEMARVENPVHMPDAARGDAIVVTVTRTGSVFLGQDHADPGEFESMMRDLLSDKVDKTIYLLADAQARYRAVENAIDEARTAGVDDVGLLAAKKDGAYYEAHSACCRAPLLPMGLEVLIPAPGKGQITPSRKEAASENGSTVVLQVLDRAGAPPAYKINESELQKADLTSRLTAIYQTRAERVLFIKGDDDISFAAMADAIDIAQSAGVDHIALLTPAMMAGQ